MTQARSNIPAIALATILLLSPSARGAETQFRLPRIPGWMQAGFAACALGAICNEALQRSEPPSRPESELELDAEMAPAEIFENQQLKTFKIEGDGKDAFWPTTDGRFVGPKDPRLTDWLRHLSETQAKQVYAQLLNLTDYAFVTRTGGLKVHPQLRLMASRDTDGTPILTFKLGARRSTHEDFWFTIEAAGRTRVSGMDLASQVALHQLFRDTHYGGIKRSSRDRQEVLERLDPDYRSRASTTPEAVQAEAVAAHPKYPKRERAPRPPTIHRVEFLKR